MFMKKTDMAQETKKLSALKAMRGIIFAIVILVIAQILALSISEIFLGFGVPSAICNIIAGVLYVAFAILGTKILCDKFLGISMIEMRIFPIQIKPIWVISAVFMPAFVLVVAMLLGGSWQTNTFDFETTLAIVTGAVVFFGLATGTVEEIIFRGIIMVCLEKKFNIKIAIVIPSVLFGALHIIGNDLNFVSMIQLLIAGSVVGILFSLIVYESNSIWNSAVVHGIWNMTMIGGIFQIGTNVDSGSIFNFVLENKSFWVSGGDFGIEASVMSIAAYLIFIAVAVILLKKNER